MRKITLLCAVIMLFAGTAVYAQNADEIAKAAYNLPDGNTSSYTATLTLIDKAGKSRVREIAQYNMKDGEVKKGVTVFRSPKDVAGVSYLSFDYPDNPDGTAKDSDSWLYLPAMKKVRRVSGSSKDDDFQGTDFTYDDMGDRSVGKDTFAILGEEAVDGISCWKLECTAKDKSAKISRRILWVGKDNFVTYKGEYYDKQNKLFKTMECQDIVQIDGFWTTQKMVMTTLTTNHKTVYEMKDIQYNNDINPAFFTVSALERGQVK